MKTTLGAPRGARGGWGHHGVDSRYVRPMTPPKPSDTTGTMARRACPVNGGDASAPPGIPQPRSAPERALGEPADEIASHQEREGQDGQHHQRATRGDLAPLPTLVLEEVHDGHG